MAEAYIVDGLRTAIGSYGGSLSGVRPDDMAAHVLREVMTRNPQLPPDAVDDVILGCSTQSGEDNSNLARMSLLLAGLPPSVPGVTVNRLCASGLSAVLNAFYAIKSGGGHIYLVGGVESMSRAPYALLKPNRAFDRNPEIADTTLGWRFVNPLMKQMYGIDSMGETAENVAEKYGISRTAQDEFAFNSQKKAHFAQENGRLAQEILDISIKDGKSVRTFNKDEFLKPRTTTEVLGNLKPAFRPYGTVTAGNSSGINDGACVLLVVSGEALKKFHLSPLARIVDGTVVGVEPKYMGIGPVPAITKLLKRASLNIDNIDVIEINEAFASQVLATCRDIEILPTDPRLNPNGGAIALGHPLGMSGARLALTTAIELKNKDLMKGICSMCVGVGQGAAMMLETVQ